jgi:hypothetical protein
MPEVAGLDFKTDVFASWTWVYNDLQTCLGKDIEVNMDKILVEGEEAGLCMTFGRGRASLTMHRWLPSDTICFDPHRQGQSNGRCFSNGRSQNPFLYQSIRKERGGIPRASRKYDREIHVDIERRGDRFVRHTATPPDRMDLVTSVIQQGKFVEMIGDDTNLFPMERLDLVKEIPPMFMIRGKKDSMVPYRSSEAFVEKMKRTHPHVKVLHNAIPGCEHRLDVNIGWI